METALHGNGIFYPPRGTGIGFDHAGCLKSRWISFKRGKMKLIESDAVYNQV